MSPRVIDSLSQSDDLTSLASLFEETSLIVGSGTTPTDNTDNTSNAMKLDGKKTILVLLSWIGLMTLY